jgi:xanthine dehydrogenase small subunit
LVHGSKVHTILNVAPGESLLNVLRQSLCDTSVKEGCASGDCGACTVALGEWGEHGVQWRAINSCIQPAHAAHGRVVMTAAQWAQGGRALHPLQQALVDHHGSQCGFCTPGIAMSMLAWAQRQTTAKPTRESAIEALSGNLCRCTGYRPIIDAMCQTPVEACQLQPSLPSQLHHWLQELEAQDADLQHQLCHDDALSGPFHLRPRHLIDLLNAKRRHPAARVVAGATDLGLGIHDARVVHEQWLNLSRVAELRHTRLHPQHWEIGAAVNLQDALNALAQHHPAAASLRDRFAGWPVRQSGTLVGNIANGSPIGDSMPLLLALGARLVISSLNGDRVEQRECPLEHFYLGYRHNALQAHEIITQVLVPLPVSGQVTWFEKLSKRFEDDISSVCLALSLTIQDGVVQQARIGLGGVAATPVRHLAAEQALIGQAWNEASAQQAALILQSQTSPISDLRASADYRQAMLGQLLLRCAPCNSEEQPIEWKHIESSWHGLEHTP